MSDHPWLLFVILTAGASAVALVLLEIVDRLLRRVLRDRPLARGLLARLRAPVRLGVVALTAHITRGQLEITSAVDVSIATVVRVIASVTVAWLTLRAIHAATDEVMRRVGVEHADNLRARSLQTQLVIARRVTAALVTVVALVAIARSFEEFRGIGDTLLASAGLLGVVVGVAGRSTIGNMVAGVQIAVTAPMRLDDVVVIEGEFGRVEELTLTYVVVRLWDQRRLVLPCLHVVENPFENWTHRTSDIVGAVRLDVDHTTDVAALRAESKRFLEGHPHWDGRVASVQVVDAGPRTITIRLVVSAHDAAQAWDLRCDAREHLVAWLQREQPGALPHLRVETDDGRVHRREAS